MNKLKCIAATVAFSICTFFANAQQAAEEQQDFMQSNGKIYVVMAVVVTIVAGLFIYLWNLDRKISKMEKNN